MILSPRAPSRFGRVHEAKLERWFGKEVVEKMLYASCGIRGLAVPILGAPAAAYEGIIIPRVAGGAGFASLSDLIAEMTTGGKGQPLAFNKTGAAAPVAGASQTLWPAGVVPVAGAAPAAPPGGTVPDRTTAGGLQQQNPTVGGDTQHVTTGLGLASTAVGTLMLYDYLFGTTTAANPGTGAVAVTGVQNRYTGAVGTPEYAAGNFISNFVTVVLAATAHNITYTYTDQDNNASASSGAMVGRSAAAVGSADLTAPSWAANLASGDTGVRQLTAVTFSASPATGQVAHFIGHPITFIPMPAINVAFILDGINSAFSLVKVMDNACLALLEFFKSATGAATYAGSFQIVAG